MSFRYLLLAAGSLAMAAGAHAQTPEPPSRPEPLRVRRLPTGEMRFYIPRMNLRVTPRIRIDGGALRLRTQERAFQRMDQVRERQLALQDRARTRQREAQDRVRTRQFELQDQTWRRQLDARERAMSRMNERMGRIFERRPFLIRRHLRTI